MQCRAFSGSILDYGSLMQVGLQRSKTARELILTMDALTMKYGYASAGESFSIADGAEAWIMEMMSRGTCARLLLQTLMIRDGRHLCIRTHCRSQ